MKPSLESVEIEIERERDYDYRWRRCEGGGVKGRGRGRGRMRVWSKFREKLAELCSLVGLIREMTKRKGRPPPLTGARTGYRSSSGKRILFRAARFFDPETEATRRDRRVFSPPTPRINSAIWHALLLATFRLTRFRFESSGGGGSHPFLSLLFSLSLSSIASSTSLTREAIRLESSAQFDLLGNKSESGGPPSVGQRLLRSSRCLSKTRCVIGLGERE